jgi:hypothetical protein
MAATPDQPENEEDLRRQVGREITMVVEFKRDNSGLMFGSFFLHSLIPKN